MLIKKSSNINLPFSEVTPSNLYFSRRKFLEQNPMPSNSRFFRFSRSSGILLVLVCSVTRASLGQDIKQQVIDKGRAIVVLINAADYHAVFLQFNEGMARAAPDQ